MGLSCFRKITHAITVNDAFKNSCDTNHELNLGANLIRGNSCNPWQNQLCKKLFTYRP